MNDDVCGLPFTPIHTIQGSGAAAAIAGASRPRASSSATTRARPACSGFYLQDRRATATPPRPTASSSSRGNATRELGDLVRRHRSPGSASARRRSAARTTTRRHAGGAVCGTGSVAPTDVSIPVAEPRLPERYEGMLVSFRSRSTITEHFNYGQFGEIVLSQPMAGVAADHAAPRSSAPARRRRAERSNHRAGSRSTTPRAPRTRPVPRLRTASRLARPTRFRGGDTVKSTVGVISFDFSLYRIRPTAAATYSRSTRGRRRLRRSAARPGSSG